MSDLFLLGDFAQHSGGRSRFRIECDALSDNEMKALAAMLASRIPPFRDVYCCGGASVRLMQSLYLNHRRARASRVLLVDDVLTTGSTMDEQRAKLMAERRFSLEDMGAVLWAWPPPPPWVTALFTVAQGAPS